MSPSPCSCTHAWKPGRVANISRKRANLDVPTSWPGRCCRCLRFWAKLGFGFEGYGLWVGWLCPNQLCRWSLRCRHILNSSRRPHGALMSSPSSKARHVLHVKFGQLGFRDRAASCNIILELVSGLVRCLTGSCWSLKQWLSGQVPVSCRRSRTHSKILSSEYLQFMFHCACSSTEWPRYCEPLLRRYRGFARTVVGY